MWRITDELLNVDGICGVLRSDPQAAWHHRMGVILNRAREQAAVKSGGSFSKYRSWNNAARSAGRAGSSWGSRLRRVRLSSHSIFVLIEPHVDLDGRAASDTRGHAAAQIVQRNFALFAFGQFQNLKHQLLDFCRPNARRRAFHRDACDCRTVRNRNPTRSSSSAMRAYSICCAAVRSSRIGISNCWRSTRPCACCRSTCSNRMSLVRHVLVDDPETVAAGRDDEAVVNLAERPEIGKRGTGFAGLRVVASKGP